MSTITVPPLVLADYLVKQRVWATNVVLIVGGAALVALSTLFQFWIGPVPITGQTFAVMVLGAVLGARRGAAALTTYMTAGLIGLPIFAGFSGGPAAVFKPTFGYIIGFIVAAWVIGYLAEKRWDRSPALAVAAFFGAATIPFIFGVPYLWVILEAAGKTLSFSELMWVGVWPFLPGEAIKMALAAVLVPGLWRVVKRVDDCAAR